MFWLHPLLPYLEPPAAQAREEACDDFVLRAGDASSYARTLLLLSKLRAAVASPPRRRGCSTRSGNSKTAWPDCSTPGEHLYDAHMPVPIRRPCGRPAGGLHGRRRRLRGRRTGQGE